MAKEDILKHVEEVIQAAKKDLKKNPTGDKVRQFTGLINGYNRLLMNSEILDGTADGKGDPGYYNRMMAE